MLGAEEFAEALVRLLAYLAALTQQARRYLALALRCVFENLVDGDRLFVVGVNHVQHPFDAVAALLFAYLFEKMPPVLAGQAPQGVQQFTVVAQPRPQVGVQAAQPVTVDGVVRKPLEALSNVRGQSRGCGTRITESRPRRRGVVGRLGLSCEEAAVVFAHLLALCGVKLTPLAKALAHLPPLIPAHPRPALAGLGNILGSRHRRRRCRSRAVGLGVRRAVRFGVARRAACSACAGRSSECSHAQRQRTE